MNDLTPAANLIRALVAGDAAAHACLAPDVTVTALLPKKVREVSDRETAMAMFLEWFPAGSVDELEHLEADSIGARRRVGYRVRWTTEEEGTSVFEQQAYYDAGESGITWMHLVCSGDLPVAPG